MCYVRQRKTVKEAGTLLVIVAACLLVIFICNSWAIENNSDSQPTIAEIERAIEDLSTPIDAEKISRLQGAIIKLEPSEQRRLRKELDSRMDELFKPEITAPDSNIIPGAFEFKNTPPATEDILPEDIKNQIDDLSLGSKATVDDLRKRDELVGKIASIQDAETRYYLIEYLESREKEAQAD